MSYIMYSQSSAKTNKTNQGRFYLTVKRLLDFVLSLIGIVVLMPVFIIIGILINCLPLIICTVIYLVMTTTDPILKVTKTK